MSFGASQSVISLSHIFPPGTLTFSHRGISHSAARVTIECTRAIIQRPTPNAHANRTRPLPQALVACYGSSGAHMHCERACFSCYCTHTSPPIHRPLCTHQPQHGVPCIMRSWGVVRDCLRADKAPPSRLLHGMRWSRVQHHVELCAPCRRAPSTR